MDINQYTFDDSILAHIFSFMDIITKSNMKRVCGRWNTIIGDILVNDHETKYRGHSSGKIKLSDIRKMSDRDIFFSGCYNGSLEMVNMMISRGVDDWGIGLIFACSGGYLNMVNVLLSRFNDNYYWDACMSEACKNGHLKIANLMVSYGANDWNEGLYGACGGGRVDAVKLMISKGATDWDTGLTESCKNGYSEIIRLMISSGATVCECGMSINEHIKKVKLEG